jgi:hypothetical protein
MGRVTGSQKSFHSHWYQCTDVNVLATLRYGIVKSGIEESSILQSRKMIKPDPEAAYPWKIYALDTPYHFIRSPELSSP